MGAAAATLKPATFSIAKQEYEKKKAEGLSDDELFAHMQAFVAALPAKDPLKIIIAGAPAAGKGTQCEVIKEAFNVVHLSTGDMLRAAVKEGTPLGIQAKEKMEAGELVPDDLIVGVVLDRLRQEDCMTRGWLLDGFPRTAVQADALSAGNMMPDIFLLVDVPEEVLVERVTGRRVDPETGKIYHMTFSPPTDEEVIARLVQRADDTEEKIKVRYGDFLANIDAVKGSYESKLVTIAAGNLKPEEVTVEVLAALNKVQDAKA